MTRLSLLFAITFIVLVTAAESESAPTEEVDMNTPSDLIITSAFLNEKNEIFSDQYTELLVSVRNTGDHSYNITAGAGLLYNPQTEQAYNLTEVGLGVRVPPRGEGTFAYPFGVSGAGAGAWGMLARVLCVDETGRAAVATVYNSTVTVVDPAEDVDWSSVLKFIVKTSVIAAVIFIGYKMFSKETLLGEDKHSKKQKATKAKTQ